MQFFIKNLRLTTKDGRVFSFNNANNQTVATLTGNATTTMIKVADEKNTISNNQGLNDVREFTITTSLPITEFGGNANYVTLSFNKGTETDYRIGVNVEIEGIATSGGELYKVVLTNCIVNFNEQTFQGVTNEDRKNEYTLLLKCHLNEISVKAK